MKISSINTYNPSFGQVRKSAAEQAIKDTKGNYEKLRAIKNYVEQQKDNDKYDIVANEGLLKGNFPYKVEGAALNNNYFDIFRTLYGACVDATERKEQDEANGLRLSEEFKALASEILAECED